MTKKFNVLSEKNQKELARVREWYGKNKHIGLLRALSEKSGIKRPNLCNILSGRNNCYLATLEKISKAVADYEKKEKKS